MKRTLLVALAALLACDVRAETLRKRYSFPYNPKTTRASSMVAAKEARKRFLRDFLAEKFSPEITSRFAEDIDIALDPPDQFLRSFNIVSERINDDQTQIMLTVEGDVDLASMVNALVQNKVLSFGKDAPRVMVLPSPDFQDSRSIRALRALIHEQVKGAGLRPVAFEASTQSLSVRIKERTNLTEAERRALVRYATQYNADYLIYVDAEVETKPFSQGGYISDVNFTYTILRPNGALILGEAIVSERGSGSSPMLAFDRALEAVAPTIAQSAIGQLYQAIYSDSDVIYSAPKLLEEKTLVIHWADARLVEAVVERLQKAGSRASLGAGTSDVASRIKLETPMDDFELYEWFNDQTFSVGGKIYKTPVVAYSENVIEVEAVPSGDRPRRQPLAKAPQRKPAAAPSGEPLAKVVCNLRRPQFNR
jgi:hypothetical protein